MTEDNPVRVIEAFIDELDLGALGFEDVQPAATNRPEKTDSLPHSRGRTTLLGGGRSAHANRRHLAAGPCKRLRVAPGSD